VWNSIASAPGPWDLLLAPQDRTLWPVVAAMVLFAVAGYWVARRERTAAADPAAGADARGPDAGDEAARGPADTAAE
jgi:hypothetical protein